MALFRTIALSCAACLGASAALAQQISVSKSPTCGCCNAWITHLEEAGFDVEAKNLDAATLNRFKIENGIEPEHMSCHTARVEGYTIEGHVPAADIRKLLKDRPDAVGLSVPGMPIGSPGMEMGSGRDAYDVLLVHHKRSADVYSSYDRK